MFFHKFAYFGLGFLLLALDADLCRSEGHGALAAAEKSVRMGKENKSPFPPLALSLFIRLPLFFSSWWCQSSAARSERIPLYIRVTGLFPTELCYQT